MATSSGQPISPAHRAALIMVHLSEDAATQIFKELSPLEMRILAKASREIATLPQEQLLEILNDFMQLSGASPEVRGSVDYMHRIANKALGAERAKEMLQETDLAGLPEKLAEVDARTLASLMGKEHPQTIALILAHIEPRRAAEVVAKMPEAVQPDLLRRLANLDTVSPDVVKLVEDTLISEIQMMGRGARKVGGPSLVADIMNQMEKSQEENLMRQLEEADEKLAEQVRSLMFIFDDLIHVDGKSMQSLLKQVERDTLVLALKAADEDLKAHIFKNLSERAVEMILDDMEARGAVRLSEVEAAQAEIVRNALLLSKQGALQLSKGGDDVLV